MSKLRIAGFSSALVASALIGGTLISSVAAAPNPATAPAAAAPAEPGASTYCQVFRAEFAKNLGVETSALNAAGKAAATATVDQAVTAGDLTAAQGTALRKKIAAAPGDACAVWGQWAKKVDAGVIGVIRDGVKAAADSLSMTPNQLRLEMRGGKSLVEIAAAKGVPYESVTKAVLTAVETDLDALLAKGRITQAREDRILDRLEANLAAGRFRAPKN